MVAKSLYGLGSREKAEAAHIAADLSYTRLLVRLTTIEDGQTGWSQSVQDQIQDALRSLLKPANGTVVKPTTAQTPSCEKAMSYAATSG